MKIIQRSCTEAGSTGARISEREVAKLVFPPGVGQGEESFSVSDLFLKAGFASLF
jgi:hypothetical protein